MNRLFHIIWLNVAILGMTLVGTGCGPSVKEKFDHYVQVWDQQIEQAHTYPITDSYVKMPSYGAIVKLGPKALPLILDIIEADLATIQKAANVTAAPIPEGSKPEPEPAVELPPVNKGEGEPVRLPPRTAALVFAAAEISQIDMQEAAKDVGYTADPNGKLTVTYGDLFLQEYLMKRLKARFGK